MAPITVVLSDSSRIGCELLMRGIKERDEDFEVLGCVTRVEAIVECVQRSCPDLALLSANLENGSLAGFHALSELREARLRTRLVMLLDSAEREAVIASFRGGAKGVFVRDQPISVLYKCMRRVHEGQVWADSEQLNFLLEALAAGSPLRSAPAAHVLLTAREQQVAELVSQGFSNRDISRRLNLSEHTVKNYLFRIFDKLDISTRVELAMYLVERKQAA